MLKRYGYTVDEFRSKHFLQFVSEQYKQNDGKTYHFNAGTTSVIDLFNFLVSYIKNNDGTFVTNLPDDVFVKAKRAPRKVNTTKIELNLDDITEVCFDS